MLRRILDSNVWSLLKDLAGISALAVAILTYSMLVETRRAREQQIEPQMVLLAPQTKFEFQWMPEDDWRPMLWPSGGEMPAVKKDSPFLSVGPTPVLRLKNIGSGPALDVRVEWSLEGDGSEVVKSSRTFSDLKAMVDSVHSKLIIGMSSIPFADRLAKDIPYCIASPGNDTADDLATPDGITEGYGVRLVARGKPSQGPLPLSQDCPTIHVRLFYHNTGGKLFKQRFAIRSSFVSKDDNIHMDLNTGAITFTSSGNLRGEIAFEVHVEPE
jgi:hypothetical protein